MERTLDRFGDQPTVRRASFAGHDPLSYPCSEESWQENRKQWSAVQEWQQAKAWWDDRKDRRNKAQAGWTALDYAAIFLPCITWLRRYSIKQSLLFDLLAGIAVGFTVVPQGMSYANIAGVPAVMGLYGAFMPILVYSLFGSCRQLGVGPVAVTSGLIFSGLSGVIPGYEGIMDPNDPKPDQVQIQADYNRQVIQLAFVVAILYTAIGFLRLGFLIRFLSHPVITGFTSGAALVIAAGQLKYVFGVSYKKQDTLQGELGNIIAQLSAGNFKWQEFVMGSLMILFLVSLKFIQRKWPKTLFLKALGPFIACVVGIVVVVATGNSNGKGPIKIVKNIPKGLPPVSIQQWAPINNLGHILPLAFIVMAVDMLESTSIARALARKNGYQLAYNQEVVALGVANFAGALFSSYTTTGSFSRSAINNSCGAKTQLSGFVTSIIVMCVLLFLTPVFRLMPYNTMGAIIIVGVSQLVEVGVGVELFRVHLRDFVVWLTAFIVTTFAGVEIGLLSSIVLSLVVLIAESSFPHTAILGRIGKTNLYRSVRRYKDAHVVPGVVTMRLDAPLHFGNVIHFEQQIQEALTDGDEDARQGGVDGVKFLVVDLSPVVRSDSSGAHMLYDLAKDCNDKGIQLVLCNPSCKLITMLGRINMHEVLPHRWIFVHTHDGVQAAVKAMNAMDSGEAGYSIPTGLDTSGARPKDVTPGPGHIGHNLSNISEGLEMGSSSSRSSSRGSGSGSEGLGADVSVEVGAEDGSISPRQHQHGA